MNLIYIHFLVGLLILLARILIRRDKKCLILLVWVLLGPLPASLVAHGEAPHAGRAMYMTGSWTLLSAVGASYIIIFLRKWYLRVPAGIALLLLITLQFNKYVVSYYRVYPQKYAVEWQYGMKSVVSYVKTNPRFYSVYMTDAFSQPYIFFLYYLKTPLPEFLASVKHNETKSRPSNSVVAYGKYHFGMWDQIESYPNSEILYIVNPSKYDGLRFKDKFSVMKNIKYPNGTDAFFIINGLL